MRTLTITVLIAGVLVVLSTGCSKEESGQPEPGGTAGEPTSLTALDDQGLAVKVNGRMVTNREIAEEQGRIMQQMRGRVSPQQLEGMKEAVRKQATDNVVNIVLLEQAIEAEGITASADEIESKMDELRKSFGSDEDFSSKLEQMGVTEEGLRSDIEKALKMEKLLEKQGADVREVSESEIRSYYEENAERFQQPERVRASHILIKVDPTDTEAEKAVKMDEIIRVLDQVRKGADFAQMASEHSSCPSKERGGDLGFFERGRMVKPFERAAFSLGVGEVSDIVETQFGYHIIKVTDRQEGRAIPFEEARASIASFLNTQKKREAMNAYTEKLRASATIEYLDPTQSEE